jgi:hypothetical protein
MPTMPPQVIPLDEGVDEPRPDITSLLPAPPLQTDRQYEKVTAYLSSRQVAFIKSLSAVIRTKSGVYITHSELLRAMVDAVLESGIDLSDATCEAELKRLLVEQRR